MSDPIVGTRTPLVVSDGASAVSWAAVIAGAFVASAFSLALVALGAGIGLVSISPWSSDNPSVATFGVLAAAWLIAIQLFASGIGGYLAGRLRTRWIGAHTDEVYFRDTAHGLLVWAVGAVISAGLLASVATSAASGASHAAGTIAQATGTTAAGAATEPPPQPVSRLGDPIAYFTDILFRSDHPATTDQGGAPMEMRRILARSLAAGALPPTDQTYVAQIIASRTGLSQPDAEKRATSVFEQAKTAMAEAANKAKEAADTARKTGVYVALWAFVSLLVGAFSASYMASVGGRARDESPW